MPTCADYWLEVCCVRLSDWQMISTEYRKCLRVQYKWLHLPTITECFKKSSPLKLFGIFSLRLGLFCMKFYKFVGNSYPHNYIYQFLYIYLNISSNGVNFSTSTQHFPCQVWVLNADVSWARTWWESHHFQLYPDKGWKLSTVKKVCSRVDHTGSAVLRKPGSGTGRPATASACTVCPCNPLVGATKLDNNVSKMLIVKYQTVIDCLQLSDTETCNEEKMTPFPKSCIFIFWVNRPTQNLTGWKLWYSGKINAIWWNIKINVHKLANICGYELPTNLQNFTQIDLGVTEAKIF